MNNPSTINPPTQILAKDEIWGSDSTSFWQQLADECEKQKQPETVSAAVLNELASKLDATPPRILLWDTKPIFLAADTDLWIIGDVHGDLLSFRALVEFARLKSAIGGHTAALCFLGDFFDDGPFGHTVLYEVLKQDVLQNPAFWFVVGNHDLALAWDATKNCFTADVTPHDFADLLNSLPPDSPWRAFAQAAIRWFKTSRRALVLGDGTLVAHGGCVHADRLDLLGEPNGYNHPDVLEDLVWLRAHDTARRKIPNRTSRGCQFGVEDLANFLARISDVTGHSISRVIRGHDHVQERWASPSNYAGRLLTLNAMSWQQRDPLGPFVRRPVIARYRTGESPELYQLEIPDEHVLRLYGEPIPTPCTTSAE